MHVKNHLAGKRGICANCQGKVGIPTVSTVEKPVKSGDDEPTSDINRAPAIDMLAASLARAAVDSPAVSNGATTPASEPSNAGFVNPGFLAVPPVATPQSAARPDPIAEDPTLQWFVLPVGAESQFGPAAGSVLIEWIAQGRVAADTLLWRQDWPEWRVARDVLPQFAPMAPPIRAVPVVAPIAAPFAAPVLGMPAFGPSPFPAAVPAIFDSTLAAGPALPIEKPDFIPPMVTRRPANSRDIKFWVKVTCTILIFVFVPLLIWVAIR
jgi:hypothetical protein